MIHILVVEDDNLLNKSVCRYLRDCGYQVMGCENPEEAYNLMYNQLFDMIISDIMMPKIDGFTFVETLRSLNHNIPILFMSARDDLQAKQIGFQMGIDDYMVKPIQLQELQMRIEALLRRANISKEKKVSAGNLMMDCEAMSVYVDEKELALTTREFNILYKLLSYPNKTFSRSQLMDEFWGLDTDTSLRAVDVYITKLRDKLSACNGFQIITVRGIGYKVVL